MRDILKALATLRSHGVRGASIIGAYHMRSVVPLMARALPLFGMVPVVELGGTVLALGPLRNNEIAQCVKEAPNESNAMFMILGHPMMWPEPGFIELPVDLGFRASVAPLAEHEAMRAANRATDERRKKEKDDKEKKQQVKL